MNRAAHNREVISIGVGGIWLRGTYHKSRPSAAVGSAAEQGRVGVLFLNPGFLPRASPSTVQWADAFAGCGYPSFRVDLPGMGDSQGEIPAQMLDFVNSGGYGQIISPLVKELVERFELSGIVIMGLCAGAVSAVFTAAVTKECCGLVLMDPYFFLPLERTKVRERLGSWAVWSRVGAMTRGVYDCWRYLRLLARRSQLPSNANLPLLRCWDRVGAAEKPVLILKAPAVKTRGSKPRVGDFDYLEYLQLRSRRSERVSIEFIEGTNHSFADPAGKTAVQRLTERWLTARFPVREDEFATVSALRFG